MKYLTCIMYGELESTVWKIYEKLTVESLEIQNKGIVTLQYLSFSCKNLQFDFHRIGLPETPEAQEADRT